MAVRFIAKIQVGAAQQDGKVQNAVHGQLLRLARPFLPGMPPDFGRDIHLAPVVPLGQAQGKALRIGMVCAAPVDTVVIFRNNDRLVL